MNYCYLCGKEGDWNHLTNDLLGKFFTNRSLCRAPTSDVVCDRCHWALKGHLWFWNEAKKKWSDLPVRGITVLYSQNKLLFPELEGEFTHNGKTFPLVKTLATRKQIKEWIINPPLPPFVISITESGQKYVLPWAQDGYNKDFFPVQFELDSIWINRQQFIKLLNAYETLLTWFNKAEINSGNYQSERLIKCWQQTSQESWQQLDATLATVRGSRLLELISYVAIKAD